MPERPFEMDFYGAAMRLLVLGFIRPESDYVSKDSLIADIQTDIEVAQRSLEREGYRGFREEKWLLDRDGEEGMGGEV